MVQRTLLILGLLLATLSLVSSLAQLRVDNYKDVESAVAAHGKLRVKTRNLLQEDDDDVCYEGCFAAPSPQTDPLPIFLKGKSVIPPEPMTLLECYTAATEANLTYFAVVDVYDCFGGNEMVQGWAPDVCPLDCVPDGPLPGICGGMDQASVFSMGMCQYIGAPCTPDEASPPPAPPLPPPPLTIEYCFAGCYAAEDFVGEQLEDTTSVASCRAQAGEAEGTYFGITSGNECFYSEDLPDADPVDASTCSEMCDEMSASCGTDGFFSVYTTAQCPSPPPSPPPPAPPPPVPSPDIRQSPPPPKPSGSDTPPPSDEAYAPPTEQLLPPPEQSPPPPEQSPPPPTGDSLYRCKPSVALWGVFLPGTPVKLNPTKSHPENLAECRTLCTDNDGCKGFYYKTTGWCFQMLDVYSFGKEYSTAVEACKKL